MHKFTLEIDSHLDIEALKKTIKNNNFTCNNGAWVRGNVYATEKLIPDKWQHLENKSGNPVTDEIINSYWGESIILVLEKKEVVVFPLPGTTQQLFWYEAEGKLIITTNIEHCREHYGNARPDLESCIKHILGPFQTSEGTPYMEVKQIPIGHALILKGNNRSKTERVWPRFSEKRELSREHFKDFFDAFIKDYIKDIEADTGRINIFLSGGLDSTLIAYCAKRWINTGTKLTYFNCYDRSFAISDERRHATKTAQNTAGEIKFFDLADNPPFSDLYKNEKASGFTGKVALFKYYKKVHDLCNERLISGQGGDSLFFEAPGYHALTGLTFNEKIRKCIEISNCYGIPYIKTVFGCMLHHLKHLVNITSNTVINRKQKKYFNVSSSYLTSKKKPNTLNSISHLGHSYSIYLTEIEYTIQSLGVANSTSGHRETSPYLCKPVIEALLCLPLHHHIGGVKRPIQRGLLERNTPEGTIPRFSKGYLTPSIFQGVIKSKSEITALIESGVLAPLLNKEHLQALWARLDAGDSTDLNLIGRLVEVELFYAQAISRKDAIK